MLKSWNQCIHWISHASFIFRKAFLFTQKRYKISKRTNTDLESDLSPNGCCVFFSFFFFSVLFLPVVYLSAIFTHLMIGKCACASNPNRCAPIHRPFIHRAYLWYWRKVRSWTDPLRIGGSSCNPSAVIKAPHGAIKWAAIAYRKLHYARYSPLHCTACNSIKSKLKWLFSIAINATLIG